MITVTIEQLIICKDALERLNVSPMPAKTALRLNALVGQFNSHLAEYEQDVEEKRQSLGAEKVEELKKFAEIELGRQYEIEGDAIEVEELGPLVALTPADAGRLYWLIYAVKE